MISWYGRWNKARTRLRMHSQMAGFLFGLLFGGTAAWLWHRKSIGEIWGSFLVGVCDLETGKLDASDILRADFSPHERFEVFLGSGQLKTKDPSQLQIKRVQIVGREDYKASFQRRLMKIGARLRNPSFPDDVMGAASSPEQAILVQEAKHFLQTSGQTTMLGHEEYEPIPSRLLNTFLGEFLRLFQKVKASKINWRTLSLAASYLPHDRLDLGFLFARGLRHNRSFSAVNLRPRDCEGKDITCAPTRPYFFKNKTQ